MLKTSSRRLEKCLLGYIYLTNDNNENKEKQNAQNSVL